MEPTKLQNEDIQEQVRNISPHHSDGSGMRRDNESIDDFEHLEPESSPVKEFQGHASHTKVEKNPGFEPENDMEMSLGVSSTVSSNTTDFSTVSTSKLEPAVESKVIGDGNFVSSSPTGALLDLEGPSLGGSDFKVSELPQKITSSVQLQDDFLDFSNKPDEESEIVSERKKPDSKFETEFNTNEKSLTQTFMETERDVVPEGPISRIDNLDKFMKDIDFLKSEKKGNESDVDTHDPLSDTLPAYDFSSLSQDKNKTYDEYHDTSKSDFKLKGNLPDEFGSSKSSLSAHDDVEDDYIETLISQKDNVDKKPESDMKPIADVAGHEHKFPVSVPDPLKPLVSFPEPSSKSDTTPSTDSNIKLTTDKPSVKSMPSEGAVKSKTELDDNDLDEIKPIQLFQYMGLDAWFKPDRLHPKVVELVYWRDPKKSGIVFGTVLGVLLSLSYFSLISVVAYLSLALLTGTISFRIYKNVLQAVQKTSDGHPFKDILELDLTLPQDKVREVTDIAVAHVNAAALELRRLFLVEDLVDSIKFGVLLWCLTYVGSWFNGMTLIIIAFVALFTLPKVYENNKAQIDQNLDVVRSKIADITSKVKAAIPIGKKPAEEEKKDQ